MMLLIEHDDKHTVIVHGTKGEVVSHGPFESKESAFHYVDVMARVPPAEITRLLGYEVDHVQTQPLVELSGMI